MKFLFKLKKILIISQINLDLVKNGKYNKYIILKGGSTEIVLVLEKL